MSHNFKKSLGQNFLQDKNIIEKIVNFIPLENEDVLEIGPGQGALTNLLVKKSKNVLAYEIDKELIPFLKEKIKAKNFTLKHEDFLKSEIDFQDKKIIIANIPYFITSDILFKIFENHKFFTKALIMVQKEIADKLIAKANDSNYGKLSVSSQFFANIKKVINVPRTCFYPQPNVDSAVVYFEFKNDIENIDIEKFLVFIKTCFSQQRKKLSNNLKNVYDLEKIKSVLKKLNLSFEVRPQQIDLNVYKILFYELN
ncbi:16S rRNA (adenine(1518)-N(6)/adenine(1519)-N(6))-dimethyltransferase RsmA [[Mycoplasma] mobile]|uniref:Ribosomal RNA small subunit methyltransferase A n=1 Tax=Mycoplasma mobile (strain ATCC 43663 / 163K / NCTC 11711) TaxID=267748 RepID=RSMA_MYCM1|nr:16S rRNA (adenine(1518)-N(6)/adenine(1519)-N(6))-dimethyltransferase RsmA [[Mycoplasma] mobile]Q6KH80.1 RecName: Full=Ribosomal RNA small subunit methyltransferase A; AltName: Full=16S rRNA (adenine(1518)-N(6)/adenine(1519)-N(6))-dimethyltransferase; AltName: Full=16S rRNA dimethyladenosine transferase; AltName: Full=16S rRNA dimethylase; AltName: Full=S-adenosylmethionine-6-N', N'-adenosyl(rRNA) dimethyltransferase [Mycoplasma mobile 163K]AAT28050.1 dimethyladenosine transferase rRNA modifica